MIALCTCPIFLQIDFAVEDRNMGSGCLKPPVSIGDIDLTILDSIYDDVKSMELSSNSALNRSQKMYEEIKERIAKKGQLRKLCDYLSAHRTRVCETVLHSYRVTVQGKVPQLKYATIVVLDAILSSVPKGKGGNIIEQGKALTSNHSFKVFNVSKNYYHSEREMEGNSSFRRVATEQSETEGPKHTKASPTMGLQLTSSKFQGIYLNLIAMLIKQALQSLCSFCHLSDVIFNNETQVLEIMKTISYYIDTNNYLGISLKVYTSMLTRVRESYFWQNTDTLKGFLELWGSNIDQQEQVESKFKDELTRLEISEFAIKIIEIFIQKCVCSYQYQALLEAIFQILDGAKFQNSTRIQHLLFDSIEHLQLKSQFARALIRYLMAYVGFPQQVAGGSRVGISNHPLHHDPEELGGHRHPESDLQSAWAQIYKLGHYEGFRKKFKYIQSSECKLNSMPCVAKWIIEEDLVELEELITYSGPSLAFTYVLNMSSPAQPVKDKAVVELIQLMTKMTKTNKVQLLDLLMGQVEQNELLNDRIRFTILSVCENVLSKEKSLEVLESQTHLVLTLAHNCCFENKLKIVQVTFQVLCKTNSNGVAMQLSKVCTFFDSVLAQLLHGYSNTEQKLKILEQVGGSSAKAPGHLRGIYIAFLQVLQQYLENQQNIAEASFLFIDLLFSILLKAANLDTRNNNLEVYVSRLKGQKNPNPLPILQQYARDRIPLSIDIARTSRFDLLNYSEAVGYFQKLNNKEPEALVSQVWKEAASINSNRESVYTRDRDLDDVLDIIKND